MRSLVPFRWLALVCVLAFAMGWCESNRRSVDIYRDPQHNYPQAMAQLYPGTAQVEYLTARQAEALAMSPENLQRLQEHPELLEEVLADYHQQLQKAREHYERALAAGLRSEENLQFNYAVTLMQLRADPAEIERAIAAWQRDFPHSDRDLQSKWLTIQEAHRKQEQFLANLRAERQLQQRQQEFERMYGPSRPRGSGPKTTPPKP
jgi:tetratricopeptide (TPR) repeat protein